MKMRLTLTIFLTTFLLTVVSFGAEQKTYMETITFQSLLDEMTIRSAVVGPVNYICRQASSYDRAAKKPGVPEWFANADASQFIRREKNGNRDEWVMLEANGPGAVVRWWITSHHYKCNFYIYFDGNTVPEIVGASGDLVGGTQLAPSALSAERARGRNLYLPIPFAKSIKITCDKMPEQKNLYYQINYRLYSPGTRVESFTMANHQQSLAQIAKVNDLLEKGASGSVNKKPFLQDTLRTNGAGSSSRKMEWSRPFVIDTLVAKVPSNIAPEALRHTLLVMEFDGKETVRCPLGDFFGTGIGLNPYHTWYTSVDKEGTMIARWLMPFQKKVTLYLETVSGKGIDVEIKLFGELLTFSRGLDFYSSGICTDKGTIERVFGPFPCKDFYYFHANWRREGKIKTLAGKGTKDWNYLTVTGKGNYVGDVLSVMNPVPDWWGEGDEKIYVDGETFPSHFGTGTEDYYGYAWCTPQFFNGPFHAQPRAEGPRNFGNTTNLRFRSLDAIPFTKDFRFDMEVWHWAATEVDYAVTTFWYGNADVQAKMPDQKEVAREAAAGVCWKTPFEYKMDNISVPVLPEGQFQFQGMSHFERDGHHWKNKRQIWWTHTQPGWCLTLIANNTIDHPKTITLGLTKAVDYGKVKFRLNGQPLGQELDLFIPKGVERQEITFPVPALTKGPQKLEVEITGKNEKAVGTMFGIDSVTFK